MVASLAIALGAALMAFWILAFLLFNVACDACICAPRFCVSSMQLTATTTGRILTRCIRHLNGGREATDGVVWCATPHAGTIGHTGREVVKKPCNFCEIC